MRAVFTDEQEDLRAVVAEMARDGLIAARSVLTGGGFPDEPTSALREGFSGLGISESDGGMGGSLVECAILAAELGRTVVPSPFLSHLLAIQVAHAARIDIGPAVHGEQLWALAVEETGRPFGEWATTLTDDRVVGNKSVVRSGTTADMMVVTTLGDHVVLASPVELKPRRSIDPSRPIADAFFDGKIQQGGDGATVGLTRTYPILAAALVGAGWGALELAADYANERRQFGQPVGRFQGIAHQLAEARAGLEIAWSLALYASWALDAGIHQAIPAAHAAKAKAGEAALYAAERCVQTHGGIGITAEADPHLFLRRAMADSMWLGTIREHKLLAGQQALALSWA